MKLANARSAGDGPGRRWSAPCAALLLGVGCGDASSAPGRAAPSEAGAFMDVVRPSVCPDCPPELGGESSDFGGTPHPCAAFEERGPIDAARAAELGFDIAELARRVEREVEAPLEWMLDARDGGRVAGYEVETRVRARATLGAFTHVSLDPERCAGMTCREASGQELACADRLEVGVEGDVETADGAVAAQLEGYVLLGRPGFSFHEVPAGTLRAPLHDVTGTLALAPGHRLPMRWAALFVDLYFGPEHTDGDLRPVLYFEDGECCARVYSPLVGSWRTGGAR